MSRVEEKRRSGAQGGLSPVALIGAGLLFGILGVMLGMLLSSDSGGQLYPNALTEGTQKMWVDMTADSLAFTGDEPVAQLRIRGTAEQEIFSTERAAALIGDRILAAQSAGDLARETRLRNLAQVIGVEPVVAPLAPAATDASNTIGTLAMTCGGLLLLLLLLGGGAMVLTRMRQKPAAARNRTATTRNRATVGTPSTPREPRALNAPEPSAEPMLDLGDDDLSRLFDETAEAVDEGSEQPVRELRFAEPPATEVRYGQALDEFVTRYSHGDDGYDMSFSIETAQTEFLGECGVGISEVLNEGSPQQATAFEVWLFDKDDIRTVTKVLLSDHAWNSEELRARLAPKGELVHIKEGETLDLETKSLRVRARVREVNYGAANGESHAFFERLVIELTPQQKQS